LPPQKKAPEQHKENIQKEIERFSTDTSEIDSWYGYPLTLDWIVDVYFSDDDDATAYPVILDSGSSNLAIVLESCTNCGEASTTLDLTTDTDMCIEVTYGSGEWSGVEVESTYVGLSSAISTETTLAGITYQDDFFSGGSSYVGILGMAYTGIAEDYSESACSSSSSSSSKSSSKKSTRNTHHRDLLEDSTTLDATPLMYALKTDGVIDSNTFAVAMCGDDADVSIGGVESSMYTGDIDYATTQLTFGEYYGYYLIYTSGITVGTTSVTVENINLYGGLVVDTGTTLHYVPTATSKAIETEVKTTVGSTIATTSFFEWESCVSSDDLSSFPTITYTFAESDDVDATTFDVELLPKHYLLDYDDCYYWGFESSTLGIFGNIGMKDKVVVFDIENTQIGFGTGVCTTDDDTDSFFKIPKQLLGEVVSEVSKRSSSELAAGLLSAMAVVGTVLASAFVVINKLVKKSNAVSAEESESLLPPL
jgi:hypothetical protein